MCTYKFGPMVITFIRSDLNHRGHFINVEGRENELMWFKAAYKGSFCLIYIKINYQL